MITTRISESGKVTVTDEAFTEIALRNYWDKWTKGRQCKWTDSCGGNTAFKGWRDAGYDQFNLACKQIKAARDPDHCDKMEASFMKFAVDKYGEAGTARKRKRAEDADGGVEDVYNELD